MCVELDALKREAAQVSRELTLVTQAANTTESYTYDPVGSRLSSLGVSSYTNNSSNEMTSTSNATYTYDYNGNTDLQP
jgi:hypothetical protein